MSDQAPARNAPASEPIAFIPLFVSQMAIGEAFAVPTGSTVLYEEDRLLILGNDDSIGMLRSRLEPPVEHRNDTDHADPPSPER